MTASPISRWLAPGNDGSRYSSAVRHGDVIYVSGQLGARSGGEPTSFETQLTIALEGLFEAVAALGGDRESIVKVNAYLARLDDFPAYHRTYAEAFAGAALPARTSIQIGGFKPPVLIELDAIAAAIRPC